MAFAAQPRPARPTQGRKISPLAVTIATAGIVIALVFLAAQYWTEVLWFQAIGFQDVLFTEWGTRIALFFIGLTAMSVPVWLSMFLAHRNRPIYAPSTPEQATLDQYREAIEPLRKIVMIGAPLAIGFFAGLAFQAQWDTIQLWFNASDFGIADPQFQMDYSFFVFTLPVLRFLANFLMAILIISGVGAALTHYLYGGFTLGTDGRSSSATRTARIQLSLIAAGIVLVMAVNYWFDRYSLLLQSGDRFDGAGYTDINAVVPAKAIMAGVAVFVALMFIATAVRGNWRLPAVGVGLMIVSAVAIGTIYPAIVERFQVGPNAQQLESPYIQRNIDTTRYAFGLDDIEVTPYDAKQVAETNALREDAETTASIRLLDPTIVSPSFRQLQQQRGYYAFSENLSVDRYTVDGESRDTVIAVRELDLDGLSDNQRNWVNDHTVYTHGYGVVAAYGNQIGNDGRPAFFEGAIPPEGALTDMSGEGGYEPRIYFSPQAPSYSIVGNSEDAQPRELDYPTDDGTGQVNYTFPTQDITVGPSVGNFWNKLLYAIRFQAEQIVFSDLVNEHSQIVYDRDPADRVEKVAPFITLDNRVYPAVVDGKVVWILDGYTTSNNLPYSTSASLDEATATAVGGGVQALMPQEVNYIRNSVKVTVDAYTGDVTIYAWDNEDPILKAWQNVFPDAITPTEEISAELMSHIRYPEDMFKVQRTLLTRYHVDTAEEFFSGQDFWRVPDDPSAPQNVQGLRPTQPPYYQTLQMPGQDGSAFSLSTPFIAGGTNDRNVLTGYLAVNAEAGETPGQPAEDYGKLRLLELPRGSIVPGPGQVQNNFSSDSGIAQQLTLLKNNQTDVVNGNLLTLPVGGGLLYVQPVYVQASSGTQFPLLRKVLVAFGDRVEIADTLDEALDAVFGGESGATAGDAEVAEDDIEIDDSAVPEPGDTPPGDSATEEPDAPQTTEPADPTQEPSDSPSTPGSADARADLDAALQDARQAMEDSQKALTDGDFTAYGEAQARLQQAVERALAAEEALQ